MMSACTFNKVIFRSMHPIHTFKKNQPSAHWKGIKGCFFFIMIGWPFFWQVTFGQGNELPDFKQQVFTTANGLSNSNIRVIAKDKTGYLWIGTANGLSRFDGHYFTNFFHTPGDSNTIGHNFIQGIICDKKGNIWILHVLGLSLFRQESQYFSNYPIQKDYPHFSGAFLSFAEDYAGNLWIGNQNGLAVFNSLEKRYLNTNHLNQYLFSNSNGFAGTGINGIIQGEKGQMWFNDYHSIFTWDPIERKMAETNNPILSGIKGLSINYVDTLACSLYLGTFNKGLIRYDYKSIKWTSFRSGEEALSTKDYDPVRNLQPYQKSLYAFISELGLGFLDKDKGKLVTLQPVPLGKDWVMQSLLTDHDNIWAGTDNGLLLFTHEKIKVENITPPNRNSGAFNTVQVQPLQPFIFTGNYNRPSIYKMPAEGGSKTDLKGITGYLRYYYKDSKDGEWISTEDAIYRKTPDSNQWEKVFIEFSNKHGAPNLPRNFIQDAKGNIYVRIRNAGLWHFDSLKKSFIPHKMPTLPENSIYSGLAYTIATNTLWVSEENTGLYALNLNSGKWNHHPLQVANTPLTPVRIVAGKDGAIAFSDPFNGIGLYFPGTKKTILVSQKDGLPSNNVSSIDVDTEGNFWTFSTEGISKVMAKDYSVANFQQPDLVKIQEIACGSDGMVYVAAAEGLYRFNGTLLEPQKTTGKLLINKLEVMGNPYPFTDQINLPPAMSDIQIHFSYVDLYSGSRPAFEYRFESEQEWKNLGERNIISLSRLSPGAYTITLRKKNDPLTAQWQSLSWTIEKPFWQRSWFMLAGLLATGAGVYFFTQRRISAIREKAALKQKMAETEMAALQAQMNPHFIFNSINCIDAMVQEGDKYNATTYLNKFAKLLRNVLEGSRNTTVSLSSDMETLRLYIELECMRMDENFEWEIDLPDEVAAADIRVPSLIIQPYVENAILHGLRHLTGKKGILKVKVGLNGDVLSYQITDNGVGREFAKTIQKTQHTSFGLDITRERIEHFNLGNRGSVTITDLKNEKGEPGGTEVKVLLPLN